MTKMKNIAVLPAVHGQAKLIAEERGIPMGRLIEMLIELARDPSQFRLGDVELYWEAISEEYSSNVADPKDIRAKCGPLWRDGKSVDEIMDITGYTRPQVETIGTSAALERVVRNWDSRWTTMPHSKATETIERECKVSSAFAIRILRCVNGLQKPKRYEAPFIRQIVDIPQEPKKRVKRIRRKS